MTSAIYSQISVSHEQDIRKWRSPHALEALYSVSAVQIVDRRTWWIKLISFFFRWKIRWTFWNWCSVHFEINANKWQPSNGSFVCIYLYIYHETIKSKQKKYIFLQSRRGDTGPTSSFFLFQLLISSFCILIINGFQGRRSLGFLMMINYLSYLLFCLLSEFEVMHPYGTDHAHGDSIHDWIGFSNI